MGAFDFYDNNVTATQLYSQLCKFYMAAECAYSLCSMYTYKRTYNSTCKAKKKEQTHMQLYILMSSILTRHFKCCTISYMILEAVTQLPQIVTYIIIIILIAFQYSRMVIMIQQIQKKHMMRWKITGCPCTQNINFVTELCFSGQQN